MSLNIPTQYAVQEYRTTVVNPIINLTEVLLGKSKIRKILENLGVEREYFQDKNLWISMSFMDDFFLALEHYGVDPRHLMYEAGLNSMSQKEMGFIYFIFARFPNFSSLLSVITLVAKRLNKVVKAEFIKTGKSEGIIELTDLRPLEQMHDSRCESWRGNIEGASKLYLGEKHPATISETTCRFKNDDKCRFHIMWSSKKEDRQKWVYIAAILIVAAAMWYGLPKNTTYLFGSLIVLSMVALTFVYSNFSKKNQIAEMRRELLENSKTLEKKFRDFNNEREAILEKQLKANDIYIEKLKRVAHSVAHEINNPLAIISGQASLIDAQTSTSEVVNLEMIKASLASIVKAVDRASFISNALYLYSGGDENRAYNVAPISLDFFEKSFIELVKSNQPSYIFEKSSENTFVSNQYLIEMSKEDLRHMFLEIIKNAKFSFAEKKALDPAFVPCFFMDFWVEENFLIIALSDNGIGFSEEALAKGLDLFYSSKSFGQGKGLGLNLIERIVRSAGGTVYLRNNPSRGAVVELKFPRKLSMK